MPQTSLLIKDLTKVPNIIGGLGLSIAAAQKAFNLDYLENVERLIALAKAILDGQSEGDGGETKPIPEEKLAAFQGLLKDLLTATAPSRYQFTETSLAVRLDLAQTLDLSATVGLGLGFGGLALNAAFTIGYGYDYRAAAECRTVIHAIPADQTVFKPLLERAKELDEKALALPDRAEVDERIIQQTSKVFEKMIGLPPRKIKEENGGQGGGGGEV